MMKKKEITHIVENINAEAKKEVDSATKTKRIIEFLRRKAFVAGKYVEYDNYIMFLEKSSNSAFSEIYPLIYDWVQTQDKYNILETMDKKFDPERDNIDLDLRISSKDRDPQ